MTILSVQNVGKQYRLRRETGMFMKEVLRRMLGRGKVDKFWALKDIDFDVKAGQSIGIIGPNGSGKSTLLRIIAGITTPTEGDVVVEGRVASLLELGAGFHPYLTGRENVYLNGALLGIKKEQISRNFDKIVDFSGIGEFIDMPVKDYSSGMFVRLAFSVAIHSDPDIFLVDEVLSVGDEEFQLRCRERIRELQHAGKTIVFVSHDLAQVNEICDELVLLQKGKMVRYGDADSTINYYLQTVGNQMGITTLQQGPVEAVFNNGRLSLFWNGHPLTKRMGLYASVLYRGGWHETTHAAWQVAQKSPAGFTAIGTAWRLPVEYRWQSRFVGERTVETSIEMRTERRVELQQKHLSLLLRPELSRWVTACEEGSFDERHPDDQDWHPLTGASSTSSFLAAYSDDERFPAVIERIVDRSPMDLSVVFNSDYVLDAGILQTAGSFTPGQLDSMAQSEFAPLGKVEITVDDDPAVMKRLIAEAVAARTVQAAELRAFFDRGRLHLFWHDTEFTVDKCGYTSILSAGMWHESITLSFDSQRTDDGALVAEGRMRRLPITQRWSVRALEPGSISWSIDFIVHEQVELDEWHTTLLVAPQYGRWFTPHENGEFPPIPAEQTDWIHVSHNMESGAWIAAETAEDGLPPRVEFDFSGSPVARVPTAINTSYIEGGRALQSLEVRSGAHRILPPGEHHMFTSRIAVGGSESDSGSKPADDPKSEDDTAAGDSPETEAGTQSELRFD